MRSTSSFSEEVVTNGERKHAVVVSSLSLCLQNSRTEQKKKIEQTPLLLLLNFWHCKCIKISVFGLCCSMLQFVLELQVKLIVMNYITQIFLS